MPSSWSDIYLRHYQRHFGKPFDVQTYHGDDDATLKVATYDQPFANYHIYASAGLSDYVDPKRGTAEIIVLDNEKGKEVKKLLVNYLFFILQQNIPLAEPFTIGGLDRLNPDFADYYNKVAMYFTLADGFGKDFGVIDTAWEKARVFQGIFISWAEQDYINRKGAAAFEEKYRAQEGELWSLNRPPCV